MRSVGRATANLLGNHDFATYVYFYILDMEGHVMCQSSVIFSADILANIVIPGPLKSRIGLKCMKAFFGKKS